MAILRGFEILEDRYYLIEKHVWCLPGAGGVVRVGLTPVAYHLLGDTLVAIAVRASLLDQAVPKGRSVAMVESLKYNGPVPAPFAGVLLSANPLVTMHPEAAAADPYTAGWIVEMQPADWAAASAELASGEAMLAAYRAALERQGISRAL